MSDTKPMTLVEPLSEVLARCNERFDNLRAERNGGTNKGRDFMLSGVSDLDAERLLKQDIPEMQATIKLLVPALRHAVGCSHRTNEIYFHPEKLRSSDPCPECIDAREKLERIDGRE